MCAFVNRIKQLLLCELYKSIMVVAGALIHWYKARSQEYIGPRTLYRHQWLVSTKPCEATPILFLDY